MIAAIVVGFIATLVSAVATFLTIRRFQQSAGEIRKLLLEINRRQPERMQRARSDLLPYVAELALLSPAAAILASLHEVEVALERHPEARQRKAVDASSIEVLRRLRNELVHGKADEVDKNAALDVAMAAHKLAKEIESN